MAREPKTGDIISIRFINSRYGEGRLQALNVLGVIESIPREKRGEQQKYKLLTEPPSAKAVDAKRDELDTTSVADLIENAFSEIESLGEELQEWYDNLPENFQNGDKGDAIQSAVDTLDNIQNPDPDGALAELLKGRKLIYHPPTHGRTGRDSRASDTSDLIQAAINEIEAMMQESVSAKVAKQHPEKVLTNEMELDLRALASDLEDAMGELDGVEWPSAF